MKLCIWLPHKQLLMLTEVSKLIVPTDAGMMGILPKRLDCVVAVKTGILSYYPLDGERQFAALDDGLLVKQGDEVLISVHHAVIDAHLEGLPQHLAEHYVERDEQELAVKQLLNKLETRFMLQQ